MSDLLICWLSRNGIISNKYLNCIVYQTIEFNKKIIFKCFCSLFVCLIF